jgi:hypothetical protein
VIVLLGDAELYLRGLLLHGRGRDRPEMVVRIAKLRWPIEHDYRELNDGLGFGHFEGRSWLGWHRHTCQQPIPDDT